MKHSPYVAAALLAVLTSIAGAKDRAAGDLAKANFGKAPAARAAVSTSEAVSPTTIRQVLAREFTILPGTTAFFEWSADLSGADHVGISLTTLSDPQSRLTQVRIAVAFAAPGDWYILTDVILCNSFYYLDHGGATVPVYGPLMKLLVSNDGSTPVRITQLSAYAVAH
jgi:hypothetical protein